MKRIGRRAAWNITPSPGLSHAADRCGQQERALFKALDNWIEAARFGADVQQVVALRLMRLASGGPDAATEAHQMISEKVTAFAEAQTALFGALATGSSLDTAAELAYVPLRRAVSANSRRLGS
jgi:hypothetical protein